MYISKSEISQIHNVLKYWNSQNMTISEDLRFAVSNKYLGKTNMSEDFWEMKAFYVDYNIKNYSFNKTLLTSYNCIQNEWTDVEDQFLFLELENAMCFNVAGYEISGNSNTKNFKYITIEYFLKLDKQNLSSEYNSKLAENIAQYMPVADFYFKEGIFEISGKSTEPSYYINSISINNTFNNVKELNLYLSNDELVINQDKIILNKPKIRNAYTIAKSEEKISVRAKAQTNSLAIKILSSKEKSVINISFMTLSEMLARVGGIIQNIITIFFLINYTKNYWSYELNLYNDVFKRISKDNSNRKSYSSYSKMYWNKENNILYDVIKNSPYKNQNNKNNMEYSSLDQHSSATKKQNNSNKIVTKLFKKSVNNQPYREEKSNSIIHIKNINDDVLPITTNSKYLSNANEIASNPICKINRDCNDDLFLNENKFNTKSIFNENNQEHSSPNLSYISSIKQNKDKSYIPDNSLSINKTFKKITLPSIKESNSENNSSKKSHINMYMNLKNNEEHINHRNNKSLQENNIRELENVDKLLSKVHIKQLNSYIQIEEINSLFGGIELSLIDYLQLKYIFKCTKSFCKKANKKRKLYFSVDNYLNDALDISNLERTYLQFNLLKYFYFDEEQLKIFNNVPLLASYSIIKSDQCNELIDSKNKIDFSKLNNSMRMNTTDKKLYGLFLTNYQ